jgi:threonine dehydratase
MMHADIPTFDDVARAAVRIRQWAHRTPVLTCRTFDELTGASLFFKCENFQKVGAFKFRGACNAIMSLSEDEARLGVVTMSSGNHAAAVSLAARMRSIPAYIAMPETAPESKKRAVEGYGGKITYCANTEALGETALRIQEATKAHLVHPFDDPRVIAGQGTATLELLADIPGLEAIIAPVSGGGLLSGTCVAAAGMRRGMELFGAEPRMADDACRSFRARRLITDNVGSTIADGLRATLSERTLSILSSHLRDIITVTEEDIIGATKNMWQRMKIVVEPSGAVPLAAILAQPNSFVGKRVGVIVSGGNVDVDHLPWH